MSVPIEAVVPGSVFQFKTAARRVVNIPRGRHGDVVWEYADGKKRAGRLGGQQRLHYFAGEARPINSAVPPSEPMVSISLYIAMLRRHLVECPIDGAVCNACAFVRTMLAEAEGLALQ